MTNSLKVVILAKSYKNGGFCVGGLDMNTNQWVRIVSDDEESHGAVFHGSMKFQDGSYCQPLDVVRVPVLQELPGIYQPENILMDRSRRWVKICEMSIQEVLAFHEPEIYRYLLGNSYPYITSDYIDRAGRSLILVKVQDFVITDAEHHKASFVYNTVRYENMSVTDPDYYTEENGMRIAQAALVMSLPDVPYNERYFYKFIAKIYPL